MQALTLWLLEHTFEKFSHWWQKTIWMQQDCFWWARACVYVFIFITASMASVMFSLHGVETIPSSTIGVLISWSFGLCFLTYAGSQEKKVRKGQLQKYKNPAKNDNGFVCLVFSSFFWGGFSLFTAVIASVLSSYVIAFIFLYVLPYLAFVPFVACDPLPKAGNRSKLQNFLDTVFAATPQPAESET